MTADRASDAQWAAAEAAEAAYADDPGSHTLPAYVENWDRVVGLVPLESDPVAASWAALHASVAHLQVFRHYGDERHAALAVQLLDALREAAEPPALRFAAAADLATVGFERYLLAGGAARLRRAVAALERALHECPTEFPDRAALLTNLGNALLESAERGGDDDVLDRAVAAHDDAVALVGDAPYAGAVRVGLATTLLLRYRRRGAVADLDRAEALHAQVAKDHAADGPHVLIARCDVRWERYALTGDLTVLDEIVDALRAVVDEVPDEVPVFATAAGNLANALLEQQVRAGTRTEVLALLDRALTHAPPGTPERARLVHVRGAAAWHDYVRTGDIARLSAAIALWAEAVGLLGRHDTVLPAYLNSLAVGRMQRHAHLADPADLAAALAATRRALRLAARRSVDAPVLWNTLGHGLLRRYARDRRRRDVEEAVGAWRQAVALLAPSAALLPACRAGLANGLRERAARRGVDGAADLRESVRLLTSATAAVIGSREEAGQLVNLGLSLRALAARTGDGAARGSAATAYADAVQRGLHASPGEALRGGLA